MSKKSLKFQILMMFAISLFVLTIISLGGINNLKLHAENNLKISASDIAVINSIGNMKSLLGHQTEEWKNIIIRGANPEENAKYSLKFENVGKSIDSLSIALFYGIFVLKHGQVKWSLSTPIIQSLNPAKYTN